MRDSKFTFFISGKKDNDRLALNYLKGIDGDCRYLFFKLPYVLPYQRFDGIRRFQYAARYRPFSDSTVRRKTCILDLSEWVEHPGEEYLEIFLKFLHDYHGFFDFEYLITVSDFSKQDVR
ncbi:MAG: hypothetical protein LUF30_04965, partial [Lachnospiraceae bacterium]|nr:hypothetical protein [Lachnospiraceae bacterium]